MYQDRNCIEEQSFFLDFNINDRIVRGHTKVKINIENPNLQETIPFSISFCAKQINIKSIDLVEFSFQKDESESNKEQVENINLVKLHWDYPSLLVQVFKNNKNF